MNALKEWAAQWGDLASLGGLAVSLVGFGVTLFAVWRSKSAAEQARTAVEQIRRSIQHYDAIADVAAAMALMDEIKRLHRQSLWSSLPDRYSTLRQRLIRIKNSEIAIAEEHRKAIQDCLDTFAALERRIELAVMTKGLPPNPAKLNGIVSAQLDVLEVILLTLQMQVGK